MSKSLLTTMSQVKNFVNVIIIFAIMLVVVGCGGAKESDKKPIEPAVITPERDGHSVARLWNEVLLDAIRNDYARPTVHARNLWHVSAAMYDAWATYQETAKPYLFGQQVDNFVCSAASFSPAQDVLPEQEKAISYAAYHIIHKRFSNSPGARVIKANADELMKSLGFDTSDLSQDYSNGSASGLGNAIADCYLRFGLQDGSNEQNDYANTTYKPVNAPLVLDTNTHGNATISDLNHWQPLDIKGYIDQAGNPITKPPEFLGPEWGQVIPFSLSENDKTIKSIDNFDYQVYFDPGMPPQLNGALSEEYQWSFAMVAVWSSHLDQNDGVMWDISPKSLGNITVFPNTFEEHHDFYQFLNGGDTSSGYTLNPKTGESYQEQLVPRGDYTRVLAEFWADGPDSETPPGHWFVLLNTVSDHPLFVKRWAGKGDALGNLEWDIKSYFSMGGTMHDSAISAWGIKGRYDYIRPVSAIRAMADLGQSSNDQLPSFHTNGLPLIAGNIELVDQSDVLAGDNNEHVGKLKIRAWRGPNFISNPEEDQAGVGWILAEDWWPYQRPSFVTPPFAGYVSGHSTYSRAAAELMTAMTGDPYFPGGLSEFTVKANEFLVFEKGPSVDMTLQWATYRDASDQCSLSRIWGGIHPPADDIAGRLIGEKIGKGAYEKAQNYFNGTQ